MTYNHILICLVKSLSHKLNHVCYILAKMYRWMIMLIRDTWRLEETDYLILMYEELNWQKIEFSNSIKSNNIIECISKSTTGNGKVEGYTAIVFLPKRFQCWFRVSLTCEPFAFPPLKNHIITPPVTSLRYFAPYSFHFIVIVSLFSYVFITS